jgi:hypothetical protein
MTGEEEEKCCIPSGDGMNNDLISRSNWVQDWFSERLLQDLVSLLMSCEFLGEGSFRSIADDDCQMVGVMEWIEAG